MTVARLASMLLVLGALSSGLAAQPRGHGFEVATGVAAPSGSFGLHRGTGPVVRLGVINRESVRPYRFRLDIEALSVPTRTRSGRGARSESGFRALGAGYNVLVGPAKGRITPYAIAGTGLQLYGSRSDDAIPAVYPSLRAGVGVRGRMRKYDLSAEVARAGAFQQFSLYWPITIALTF